MGYLSDLTLQTTEGRPWRLRCRPELRDRAPFLTALLSDPESSLSAAYLLSEASFVLRETHGELWVLRRCQPRSSAKKLFELAHRLRAAGIETPAPLAFVEAKIRPEQSESWLITRYVNAPQLSAWCLEAKAVARRNLATQLGRVLARLTELHLPFPSDAAHLKVIGSDVCLTGLRDLHGPLGDEAKALLRLAEALPTSPRERWAFFQGYFAKTRVDLPRARRNLTQRIAASVAQ